MAGGRTVGVLSLYASADRLGHMERLIPQLRSVAAEAGARWSLMSALSSDQLDLGSFTGGNVSDPTIAKKHEKQMSRETSGSLRRK